MIKFGWILIPAFITTAVGISALSQQTLLFHSPALRATDALSQSSHILNEIARECSPAVVSITSIQNPDSKNRGVDFSQEGTDRTALGIGSGVILRPEGVILTNHHVIQNSNQVTVALDDKVKASAHVIGLDLNTDLAVIQLDKKPERPLPTLTFGDSDQAAVGDWAIAIGSPFGLIRTVTTGIISAKGRGRLGMLDIEDFIQTDAAINPGNSGGPLLDTHGKMVGINTAIFSQTGGFIGIGFAIPAKIAQAVAEEIILHGHVSRGWMGISAQDVDIDLAQFFALNSIQGALVSQVLPRGPADQASIKVGDIIRRYGETRIDSANHLKTLVAKTKIPSKIPIEIYRSGSKKSVFMTIREQPHPQPVAHSLAGQAGGSRAPSHPTLGLALEDIPVEYSHLYGISPHTGAIIAGIKPGSPAFYAGLGVGDIVLSANKTRIHSAKELLDFIKKAHTTDLTVFYVQKGPDEKVFVPVKSNYS